MRSFFFSLIFLFVFSLSAYNVSAERQSLLFYGTQANQSLSFVDITDSSNNGVLASGTASQIRRIRVDIDNNRIFWTAGTTNAIYHSEIDGSNVQILISGLNNPNALDIDPENMDIYFSESGSGVISKVNYDGSGLTSIISTGGNVQGLAYSHIDNSLYWTNFNNGEINKIDLITNSNSIIASTGQSLFDLVINSSNDILYFTERTNSSLNKINTDGSGLMIIVDALGGDNIGTLFLNGDEIVYAESSQEIVSVDLNGLNPRVYVSTDIGGISGIAFATCKVVAIPSANTWSIFILALLFMCTALIHIYHQKHKYLIT